MLFGVYAGILLITDVFLFVVCSDAQAHLSSGHHLIIKTTLRVILYTVFWWKEARMGVVQYAQDRIQAASTHGTAQCFWSTGPTYCLQWDTQTHTHTSFHSLLHWYRSDLPTCLLMYWWVVLVQVRIGTPWIGRSKHSRLKSELIESF